MRGSNAYTIQAKEAKTLSQVAPSQRLSEMEDGELWRKFKEGDESAFVFIYNQHFEYLCHFGVQYVQLPVVEDCIQDMFVALRSKKEKLPEIKHSIRHFLFQSLKRRIINVVKRDKLGFSSEVLANQHFEIVPPHEALLILNQSQKEKLEKLDTALAGLSEKQREVVYYYFYKGMSYEEIQKLMGYDHVKSARNMIYRIISTLKNVLSMVMIFLPDISV